MGQPLSKYANPKVPLWIQKLGLKISLKLLVGDLKHYGLPKPDHAIFDKHPTIGTELLHYIKLQRATTCRIRFCPMSCTVPKAPILDSKNW